MPNRAVVEYCVSREGPHEKWGFRFKTPAGKMLAESPKTYDSRAEAEQGIVALIESLAASQMFRMFSELRTA